MADTAAHNRRENVRRAQGAQPELMEDAMLKHKMRRDGGNIFQTPEVPPGAADFTTLAGYFGAYPGLHGTLRGILIHEQALRAWNDLGALLAQLQCIKQYHRKIEKVAIVADGGFATVIPFIASHFIHAQVKHFDHAHDESAAWDWLRGEGRKQMRTAA
jgi:hypothetical protein